MDWFLLASPLSAGSRQGSSPRSSMASKTDRRVWACQRDPASASIMSSDAITASSSAPESCPAARAFRQASASPTADALVSHAASAARKSRTKPSTSRRHHACVTSAGQCASASAARA